MAVNFRLSANTGYDYTDLLPHTAMKDIENNEDILKFSELRLKIPAFSGTRQEIAQALTPSQIVAPFDVDLLTKGSDAMRAYWSIDQIETTPKGFAITRLYSKADTEIEVLIRFKERGANGK